MIRQSQRHRTFREQLDGPGFSYGVELVTTRGVPEPAHRPKPLELGEALAEHPKLGWLSITDNAGGHPTISPDCFGRLLHQRGVDVVLHLTCKDMNRNALESRAWQYAAEGFDNILALTGDYPAEGYHGLPGGVFDLDAVSLITMLAAMNDGLEVPGRNGQPSRLPPTRFHIGCAVSPFKQHEAELMPQYFKLLRKIRAGARWVIPQLGYDMRKSHEVQLGLRRAGLGEVPIVANVYVLSRFVAKLFNRNAIPGCVVSDALLAEIERYAGGPDKGRRYFRELAAKQLAVYKGLGFAAGYLGGVHSVDAFAEIMDIVDTFAPDDWRDFARELQYPQPNEFYLFERDASSGLGDAERLNAQYLASLQGRARPGSVTVGYRFSRLMHGLFFTPGRRAFPLLQRWFDRVKDGGPTSRAIHALERMAKAVGFGCRDCGDCALPDCAYQCPLAACSKGARNGPCGGSLAGVCELGDKPCLWARAYERTKYYGEEQQLLTGPPIFYNAQLRNTSAWANTYLGRDHHAQQQPNRHEAADHPT